MVGNFTYRQTIVDSYKKKREIKNVYNKKNLKFVFLKNKLSGNKTQEIFVGITWRVSGQFLKREGARV